jgi:NAD(P)-dependent dehydrogenase (short-subunit alcohol dehydrogenase family)
VGVELGLGGKVAVVTGASKGIGLAVTRRFVEEGARVIAGSRTISPELAELVDGGAVQSVIVDLAEPNGPASLVAAAGDRLDILVNNVGFATPRLDGFLAITDDSGSTRSTWISWPACARSGPPSRACSPTAAG